MYIKKKSYLEKQLQLFKGTIKDKLYYEKKLKNRLNFAQGINKNIVELL